MNIIMIASNLSNELFNHTKLISLYVSYIKLKHNSCIYFYMYIIIATCIMHVSFNASFTLYFINTSNNTPGMLS